MSRITPIDDLSQLIEEQVNLILGPLPEPPRRYVVVRDGRVFTAKPCYGMHEPWWVVQTMEGEAPPVAMRTDDCWRELDEER